MNELPNLPEITWRQQVKFILLGEWGVIGAGLLALISVGWFAVLIKER